MHAAHPILALALLASAAPLAAGSEHRPAIAPAGTEDTRYCMKVEAVTGSRIERIMCWTRAEWERQGVNVDADWPKEGVRVEG
jgi:hypothetical protein